MYKNIYDTPEEIEVSFSVSDTGLYRLPLGRMFTTYEIYTGAGKTGTELIDNTDYIAGGTSARAGEIKGESVYTGFQITNAGYHSTTLYATIYWVGTLGNTETIFRDVGEHKRFFTYKDRTASRLLPFAFDNAVSKADYADLYDEVGDVFEAMHVAAGDSASGADEFYPTPIPGYYGRTGLPDIELDASTVNTSSNYWVKALSSTYDNLRNGTKFRLQGTGTLPTTSPQIAVDTDYYVRITTAGVYMFTNEADAIAWANTITFSSAGSGTFRLTQEGVEIGDAFQGHNHTFISATRLTDNTGASSVFSTATDAASSGRVTSPLTDGTNGIPRTSNETRPATLYEFGYIRY